MRLADGGRCDRGRPITFRWNAQELSGYSGDTLASALLASGIRVVSRSVDLGRPRGVYAAGVEEPNAYAQVLSNGAWEPMLRATCVELVDGLQARGLNGKGEVSAGGEDTARYEKRFAHCDVLVVGGGPAGLTVAREAGVSGARVILVDDQPALGGGLLSSPGDGSPRPPSGEVLSSDGAWLHEQVAQLEAMPELQVLTRTTAFGYYDANLVMLAERCVPSRNGPHQRLWQVRAGRVVLATGACERGLVFADNDRPGIMLAGAIRTYLHRFSVLAGRRCVLFTNNDSVYATALELLDAGAEVAAVVDTRAAAATPLAKTLRRRGVRVLLRHAVVGSSGAPQVQGHRQPPNADTIHASNAAGMSLPNGDRTEVLKAVSVQALNGDSVTGGPIDNIVCDALGVSGGFNPVLHLFSQSGGRTVFDPARACFVPSSATQAVEVVGAAAGVFEPALNVEPVWLIPSPAGQWTTHFVDLERDVTVSDLQRGVGAGLRSIEHLKRFTTFGTGSDQGKTAAVLAAGVAGALLGDPLTTLSTTTSRPPFVPVVFGLLAGPNRNDLYDPIRVTPMHAWHVSNGAVFEDVGQWKRPRFFPRPGEDMQVAVIRESRAARERVAVIDASTLGKIELQGPDAAEFLNRLYTNAFDNLAVGAIRYGLMCRADGMIFDDGVVMRLGPERFVSSTTTGNAAAVLEWMEEWLQTEWPELRVRLTSVTDQWAVAAIVGPRGREVLGLLAPDLALDAASFPFMRWRDTTVAGVAARVCRVTYSGELSFEVHVPAWYGLGMWEAIMAAGRGLDITPYGTETMHVLRAEKGYLVVGQDTDGTVTPIDAGMDWLVSKRKPDFVGRRSLARSDTKRGDRKHLIGLLPEDPTELMPEGAPLILDRGDPLPGVTYGHVTSSYYSAALGRTFAMAMLTAGRQRIGSTVYSSLPERIVAATVTQPVFYDPENRRRDG